VLNLELGVIDSLRAKPSQHEPTVLSRGSKAMRSPLDD